MYRAVDKDTLIQVCKQLPRNVHRGWARGRGYWIKHTSNGWIWKATFASVTEAREVLLTPVGD